VPTYQYQCVECEHEFEVVQAFSDAPISTCPECGKSVRKIYSNVGVVFKGSGFYKTDSRSKSENATTDKKSEKKIEKKAESSTPAPAPKAD
jgi:putative FmdB family regulatory protein